MMDEKKHKRYLRRRRKHALRIVMTFSDGEQFRADNGFFRWFASMIKASVCLAFGWINQDTRNKEALVSYDYYFDIDHYEWTSVFINPSWAKDWTVTIEQDGE